MYGLKNTGATHFPTFNEMRIPILGINRILVTLILIHDVEICLHMLIITQE